MTAADNFENAVFYPAVQAHFKRLPLVIPTKVCAVDHSLFMKKAYHMVNDNVVIYPENLIDIITKH